MNETYKQTLFYLLKSKIRKHKIKEKLFSNLTIGHINTIILRQECNVEK